MTEEPEICRVPSAAEMAEHMRSVQATMEQMRQAFARLSGLVGNPDVETFTVYRANADAIQFYRPDQRQGEEVYVYDLRPGARVYVLEDVFTVDRVDMDAPVPTVWLKELPTSPLYFTEDEYIYLANETEE